MDKIMRVSRSRRPSARLAWWMAGALVVAGCGLAADRESVPAAHDAGVQTSETPTAAGEIAKLKAQLAVQQAQIEELRVTLEKQQKLLEHASAQLDRPRPVDLGQVASTTPMVPAVPVAPAIHPPAVADSALAQSARPSSSPLTFHIGSASITPVGFMDFTTVYRDKSNGGGIGSNFGSLPFVNSIGGQLSEFRFSAQNSRIGMRIDAKVAGADVLGYWESDFLGFSPTNAAVTSNSNNFRMRQYWIDLRKDKWEILGGQAWTMLTPNRRGLSPLPADLFYSQVIDTNYMLGLPWSRNPGFRAIYHPTSTVAMGLSLEAAEQYGGGSAGGGVITMPANLASAYASEVDMGGTTFNVPNLRPDVIAKVAFDPKVHKHAIHLEVAGVLSGFKLYNPLNNQKYTANGGGGSVNANVEVFKNFRLIANTFFSSGGGRWLFGQAPDFIIRGDGSPSPLHSYSTVSGIEYQPSGNLLLYSYYGGIYIGRNSAIDPASGKLVGYGYTGAPNGQNRAIQEITFGFNQTFWKNPSYGALSFMGQYAYLTRDPWSVALGQPKSAHLNLVMLNLRYTLPGAPPAHE